MNVKFLHCLVLEVLLSHYNNEVPIYIPRVYILLNCYNYISLYSIVWRTYQTIWNSISVLILNVKSQTLDFIYQAEIGSISSDIKILQEKSMDMGLRLKNRKVWPFYMNRLIFQRHSWIVAPFGVFFSII